MLAISTTKKCIHYSKTQFCKKHGKIVNKHHIDECDILNSENHKQVTSFNDLLQTSYLYDIPKPELKEVKMHFERLQSILNNMEEEGVCLKNDSKIVT